MNKNGKQKGFTLIELLVVVGIIATLASIAVTNVAHFMAPARATADDAEHGRVQEAMDLYIADNNLAPPPVAANAVALNDFSASNPALYPDYMREPITHCTYTWDVNGHMTQVSCP